MMRERFGRYLEAGKRMPEHILFYRDGVSESQFGMVKEDELPQIEQAVKDIKSREAFKNKPAAQAWDPKITMIVVGKRHHARFFPATADATALGQSGNCQPGTVVDTKVVTPDQFSFYLQSHDSPMGTAKSGHYVVIANGSGYSRDELYRIVSTGKNSY